MGPHHRLLMAAATLAAATSPAWAVRPTSAEMARAGQWSAERFGDAYESPTTQQCHTYGLSLWLPYHGSGLEASDPYWFRSCIFPASRVGGWDTRKKDLDHALLRRMVAAFREVQPYLLGDYYPLTLYSLQVNAWIAWQFDEPELEGGMVQAFRRDECPEASSTLKLGGLDPEASYAVKDLDTGKTRVIAGRELTEDGLRVTIADRHGAALFVYRKAR